VPAAADTKQRSRRWIKHKRKGKRMKVFALINKWELASQTGGAG